MQNKRYLNINIHGNGFFWNLGLIRISGRFSSEACLNVIVQKLNEFGVNFEKDIVAITTDGCAMMKKLGRSIASPYQLCYAHGLQLVIQDIFYQKHNEDIGIFSDGCGTDDEDNRTTLDHDSDDDFSDGLDISGHADSGNALALNLDIIETVNKVRRVVKIFKRSPLKNETLQKYVREKYPNGLNMILDCKTCWSSLVNMLERIVQIKVPTQKALLDLNQGIYFTDEEFALISSIVDAMNPIKMALEALCRRDTNLITAEATIKFLLDDIHKSKSHYHKKILESIN